MQFENCAVKMPLLMRGTLALFGALLWFGVAGCSRQGSDGPTAPAITGSEQEQSAGRSNLIDDRPVIVAFGDSLTAGRGVDTEQSYPSQLRRKLDKEGYRYRVVNAGVSGDTSAQGLNRIASVRELRPRIVVVELGANDGLRGLPVEATRQNLDAIISQLTVDGAKVILAGMVLPPNYGISYTGAFSRIFPDLARLHKVALIPFFLRGVAGHPELNQEDGIHPTAQGYSIVVENVWAVLKPIISREARSG